MLEAESECRRQKACLSTDKLCTDLTIAEAFGAEDAPFVLSAMKFLAVQPPCLLSFAGFQEHHHTETLGMTSVRTISSFSSTQYTISKGYPRTTFSRPLCMTELIGRLARNGVYCTIAIEPSQQAQEGSSVVGTSGRRARVDRESAGWKWRQRPE